jgi:acyl-CoA thioester hydrolase
MGIIMPVISIHSRFIRPARYDDLITIKTTLKELPQSHKIIFHAEIYNEEGGLLNTGEVTLYFMELKEMKRCSIPEVLKQKLERYFTG